MKVYIVRHGESQNNKDGLWTGWYDAPLTEKGKEDAAKARDILSKAKFDKIYSSDLIRARNTAEIAIPGCEYETSEALREIGVGSLAGAPVNESTKEERELYGKEGYAHLGGETRAEFQTRVAQFMKKLEGLDCDTVAIFCHAGWLRTFFDTIMGSVMSRSKILCRNCAIAVFEFDGDSWKLHSWINLD